MVRRLNLSFRDVDWKKWDDLLDRVHRPLQTVTSRSSASTLTCPTPTCRSPRRCEPAVSPTGRRCRSAGYPATTAPPAEAAEAALAGVDGVVIPGGFGVRGIEGKIGAARYAREHGDPDPGPVSGPAVHDDRGAAAPGRSAEAPTPASSIRMPPIR